MRIEGERLFVTGGSGFIGRHLVRALVNRGATCVAFDRHPPREPTTEAYRPQEVAFATGDLLTANLAAAMDGCTAVFHLAASPDVRAGEARPRATFEQNVLATARLLDAMVTAKVDRIGFASTSTVYGEASDVPTPEAYTPLAPISAYGASKLAAEGLIHGFAANGRLAALILRFANVVGGGATHGVVPDFIRKLRQAPEELEILGREPGTRKSYVHVDDAVAAMLHAWSATEEGVTAYNVGSEDAISVKDVADIVAREMDLTGVRYRWTGGVDGGGWGGDVQTMQLAVDRLRAHGWRPRDTSAEAVTRAARELLANP